MHLPKEPSGTTPPSAIVVLDFLKNLFGGDEMDPYERQVLEQEHRKLGGKIAAKRDELSGVETTKSKKKMNPRAKQIMAEIDRMKKRQREIEKQLGGKPSGQTKSRRKRRSKR